MQSLYAFIVEPIKSRYNNIKKVGEKNLILNTKIEDHRYVNRNAIVLSVPKNIKTNIKIGDEVIVHHNIFRRYNNIRGEEVDSSSYFKENKYFIYLDQIFMYKQNKTWKSIDDFCFVKPIENHNIFSTRNFLLFFYLVAKKTKLESLAVIESRMDFSVSNLSFVLAQSLQWI